MLFQVLNTQPEGTDGLYSFCADYLEQKVEERDGGSTQRRKPSDKKMRREATFNLYATDSGRWHSDQSIDPIALRLVIGM